MWILDICGTAANKTLAVIVKVGKALLPYLSRGITTGKTIVSTGKTIFIIDHFKKFLEVMTGKIGDPWRYTATGFAMFFSGVTTWLVSKAANDQALKRLQGRETEGEIEEVEENRSWFGKKHGIAGISIMISLWLNGLISIFFVFLNSNTFSMSLLELTVEILDKLINFLLYIIPFLNGIEIDLENSEEMKDLEETIAMALAICATLSFAFFDLKKSLHNGEKLADAFDRCDFACNKKRLLLVLGAGVAGAVTAPAFSWFSTGRTLHGGKLMIPIADFDVNTLGLRFTFPTEITAKIASASSTALSFTFTKPWALYELLSKKTSPDYASSDDEFIDSDIGKPQRSCKNIGYTAFGYSCIAANGGTTAISTFVGLADMIDDLSKFSRYDAGVMAIAAFAGICSGLGDGSQNKQGFDDALEKAEKDKEDKVRRETYLALSQHAGLFSRSSQPRMIELEEDNLSNGDDGNKEKSGEKEMETFEPSDNGHRHAEDEENPYDKVHDPADGFSNNGEMNGMSPSFS